MARGKASQNKYRTISISTVLILLAGFSYYYFVFVKNKEVEFHEKAFRIIQKVGTNVQGKYENYVTVTRNAIKAVEGLKNTTYSVDQLRNHPKFLSIPLELEILSVENNPSLTEIPRISKNIKGDSIIMDILYQKKKIVIAYAIENLLHNSLRYDFFQKYIVFSDDMVYYSDIATEKTIDISIDSIFKKEHGELSNLFHSTDKVELEFNNKKQLLYVTPVNITGHKTIYIGGIIDRQYFVGKTFSLGTNTTMFLLIAITLLLLSIPFLKLLLISEVERLSTSDAVMSFLSLIIGAAFIVISLLIFFSQHGQSGKQKEDYLQGYADHIQSNFLRELDAISAQITKNETILSNLNNSPNGSTYDLTDTLNSSKYKFYKLTNWMNNEGDQLVKWHRNNLTSRVNVKFRKYFNVPNDPDRILWEGNSIFIESINSVTQGITYAMVSKRSILDKPLYRLEDDNYKGSLLPTVVCMDSKFQSMTDLPLPPNIAYMVVNEKGMVMFHQDPSRILQENVFEEIGNETELRQAMVSGEKYVFKGIYDGVQSRFQIQPMGSLPLYLIVFMNEELEKNNDAQVLTLTSQFYMILFLIILLQIVLFVMVDYQKRQKTKGRNLFFGWLWPLPALRKRYMLLIAYLLAAFMIYVFGEIYSHILATFSFFSLLVTVVILVLKNFSSPVEMVRKPKYLVYFTTVFLFALLIFSISGIQGIPFWSFILYLLLSAIVIYLSFSGLVTITQANDDLKPVRNIYNSMLFLFVLFISVVPVYSFFNRSYNFEKAVKTIYLQKELTERIIDGKFLTADTSFKDYKNLNNPYYICTTAANIDTTITNHTSSDSVLIDALRRPIWSGKEGAFASLGKDKGNRERILKWQVDPNSIKMIYYTGKKANVSPVKVEVRSDRLRINWSDFFFRYGDREIGLRIAMVISLLILLFILHGLVTFWTSKLFLLGIIPRFLRKIDDQLETSKFSYIISPPYSKATYFVRRLFPGKTFTIDMRYLGVSEVSARDATIAEEKEIAMIYDTESISIEALKNKIALIHKLKRKVYDKGHKLEQIIIVSPFSPHRLQSHFEDNSEGNELIKQYLDIIGNFETYYFNIGRTEEIENEGASANELADETEPMGLLDFESVNKRLIAQGFAYEDLLLNVQNIAQLNYFAIWNSLEEREKLLIYDLAQDGLVNYKNLPVIFNMLNRGILVFDHSNRLKLFDDSFANFVLTIISPDEALEIEKMSKQSGNWSNLKLPFYTIVGGVLIFLFTTQADLFGGLIRWLTTAIAVLPLISKFITSYGMFGGKKGEAK